MVSVLNCSEAGLGAETLKGVSKINYNRAVGAMNRSTAPFLN
jgi:hypothetical protein